MKTHHFKSITKRPNGRLRVQATNTNADTGEVIPTRTQQHFKADCDINNIVRKYATTGEFTHLTSKQGRYADFSTITDYQSMIDTVRYANDAFASLPAEVRKRFNNNPGELLAFTQNSENYEEGLKLGLCQPRQTQETTTTNQTKPNETQTKTKKTLPNQTNINISTTETKTT